MRTRTAFVCQQCGNESPKWLGRCPECQQWNTYVETVEAAASTSSTRALGARSQPTSLASVAVEGFERIPIPMAEFSRVLGGGLVPGSLVLLGGDPGIGKSTLLTQVADCLAAGYGKVLYVSAEESVHQIKLRADRLGLAAADLYLLSETNLEAVLQHVETLRPKVLVVDSIQTVYLDDLQSAAGSVGQVRECTQRLMRLAKASNIPVFIVGHVTKEGTIAGPRVLEHMVDAVLYLEGERFHTYRILRGVKNRFGSTDEIGVFEMAGDGLVEVANPSQMFLAERLTSASGSIIVVTLEGTRPLLVELQALTSTTSFGLPRRTANGVDLNRLLLLVAVLTKRVGLSLSSQDIFVNVVGGLKINEPAADLGTALAITSSFRDVPIDGNLVAIGEIGLNGELRSISQVERRLAEAAKLGFKRCLLPRAVDGPRLNAHGLEVLMARSVDEAIALSL